MSENSIPNYLKPEYRVWARIIQRTTNPKCKNYPNYGGRGIGVCEQWREFDNFYNDMGRKPDGLTIERIDNNKGYFPENCIWAGYKKQLNNTRFNHRINYCGVSMTLTEWGEFLRIKPNTILTRIRRGWSLDRALEYENA